MKKDLIADITAKALVTAAFLAVAVWFLTLIPAAIDHSLAAQDAKVAHHLQMVRGGGE